MVEPGIRTGLDGDETVSAIFIGHRAACASEVGIEWRGCWSFICTVASSGICLPNFNQRMRNGASITVQYSAGDDDAFSLWLSLYVVGKVVIGFADFSMSIDRARNFRQSVWKINERLRWRPF